MQKKQGIFNKDYEEVILVLNRWKMRGKRITEILNDIASLGRIDKEAVDIVKHEEKKEE